MAAITEMFNSAELAFAAYADLSSSLSTDGQRSNLVLAGMTDKQVAEFASRYPSVVTQHNDTVTSFSWLL